MAKRFSILRVTRRTKDAVNEMDYADKLTEAETEWMEIFLAGYYGGDTDSLHLLTGSDAGMRKMRRQVSAANNAYSRDIANKHTRLALQYEDAEHATEEDFREFPELKSDDFQHYKCARCLKKAEGCHCPSRKYNKPYGIDDWTPAVTGPESAFAEAEDALNIKAFDLLPYGDNPPASELTVGRKVLICLPHHYLKNRPGTVKAYRVWTDEYLIEAERQGLKHRDGTTSSTTLCWVKPTGLKIFKPSLASKHKEA